MTNRKSPAKPDAQVIDDDALDAVAGGEASETERKRKVPAKVTTPDLKIGISY